MNYKYQFFSLQHIYYCVLSILISFSNTDWAEQLDSLLHDMKNAANDNDLLERKEEECYWERFVGEQVSFTDTIDESDDAGTTSRIIFLVLI
jgi:hypothetical protein